LRHAIPILAVLAVSLGALGACSQSDGQSAADANDKFAGLEPQLVAWRAEIEAQSPVCQVKTDGKGCQDFAVACKREVEVAPEEAARGVTARLVAAMTYSSKAADARPGSAVAEFTRTNGAWSHKDADAVNMATCQAAPHLNG
jgi:hypothetical protein